jgi:hypothetical protein
MDAEDKRKEPRFPVGVDVPVWAPDDAPQWLPASDLSYSGIFLETASPPPMGSEVVLGPPTALIKGRVVFVLLPDAAVRLGRAPGMGVQLNQSIDPDGWLLAVAEHRAAARTTASLDLARPSAPMPAPFASPPPPTIRAAIVPATDTRASAANAARRMARVPDALDEPVGAEVLIVAADAGVAEILKAALLADDYTPLIARHGLEALALCVRRRPLLAIVPASMSRLSAALFVRELRTHPETAELRVVVIDDPEGKGKGKKTGEPDDGAAAHWPGVPDAVQAVRRQIDIVTDGLRGQARPSRGKEDARELAAMIKTLADRWSSEGNQPAAVLAMRYVVELTPSSHEHTARLAWALFEASAEVDQGEALALLSRVVRQQPTYTQALFYKGVILKRRGKAADGDAFLKRALEHDPDHAEARAELERVEPVEPPAAPKSGGILGALKRLRER